MNFQLKMNRIISAVRLAGKLMSNSKEMLPKRLCSTLSPNIKSETTLLPFNNEIEEIDWAKELMRMKKEENDSILKPANEDLSHIAPYTRPTFNFAAYINKSDTLKKLLQLGVNLHKIEKMKSAPEYILKLDFENDIKKHIFFLHDLGVTAELLADYITTNPYIFQESIEDLTIRINYLQSKGFDAAMITRIVTKNPYWLMFSTKRIDTRLGYFQNTFKLTGSEVRSLATKQPKLITYNMEHVKLNTFSVKEEMGFDDEQMKTLLIKKPKLWMMSQSSILERFEYIHKTMNIPHERILKMPKILACRKSRIKQRHEFLEKLGRAQYDPKTVNYISMDQLIEGTDSEFCSNVAKSSVHAFNMFLKSL